MTELRVFTTTILGSVPVAFYWALGFLLLVGVFYLNRLRGSSGSKGSRVNPDKNACRYWGRSVARLLLVEWIILVLGIAVIFREPRAERSFCLIPFLSYFDYGTNSYFMEKAALNILNVVLFLPVGFLSGVILKGWPWWKVMIPCLCISLTIELLQLILMRGFCETDDVIHNILGALIGYGVGRVIKKLTIDN